MNRSRIPLSEGRTKTARAYKAESAGGQLIQVNPRNTTQNCFRCGEHVKKNLSERMHECPHCGLVMSRDHNAALNILARGRGIGQELPKFRSVEEKASTQPQLVEQVYPVKQEASLLVGR